MRPHCVDVYGRNTRVDQLGERAHGGVGRPAKGEDGHTCVGAVRTDERRGQCGSPSCSDEALDRGEVHRHTDGDVPEVCQHAMLVRVPLGEPAQVPPHAVRVGVEEVCAVPVDPHSVSVELVVRVAADVVPPIDHHHSPAELRGDPLGDHRAGEAGAHDEPRPERGHCASSMPSAAQASAKRTLDSAALLRRRLLSGGSDVLHVWPMDTVPSYSTR